MIRVALELTEVFGVDTKIGLKRMADFHARRNINERSAREYGTIQGGEFVVARWDYFAEPLLEYFRVLHEPFGAAHKNDTIFCNGILDIEYAASESN